MPSQMKQHSIKRGDGRTVEFVGRKKYQVGKAGLYETEGGNFVFQYAPHGNGIGLILTKLPDNHLQAEELMAEFCNGHELDGMLRAIGAATLTIA